MQLLQNFKEKKDELQKTMPIEDVKTVQLYLDINGKNYVLQFNIEKGKQIEPKVFTFEENNKKLQLTISLAPFYCVETFENLYDNLINAGITISRSPSVDVITGNDKKYLSLVFNLTVSDKDNKPIPDEYSARIILLNKSEANKDLVLNFSLSKLDIKITKIEIDGKPTFIDEDKIKQKDKTENQHQEQQILVYPNPAQRGQLINIEYIMPKKDEYSLELYDSKGNKICCINSDYSQKKNEEGEFVLNLPEDLTSGLYLIVLKNKEGKIVSSSKLVID